MIAKLNLLMIEDDEGDALLNVHQLQKAGYEVHSLRVETAQELKDALKEKKWDIVFSDNTLPGFDAKRALSIFQSFNLDIPFVVISGAIGEEAAVDLIKSGAHDFIMKGNSKLPFLVKRELADAQSRRELLSAHKELLKSNEALESALKSREEFLMIASHELKTPITSLKLRLQMLKRKVQSDEVLNMEVSFLISQINRLTKLIESMLDVARIQAGKLSLEFSEVNLQMIIYEVIEQLSAQTKISKCTTEISVPADIFGVWDQARISQVLVNLLSNALKYAPGSLISISALQDKNYTTITLKDSGPGIPVPKQALIFERFERAGASISTSGLGLGLYISKQIIEAQGGTINLETKTDKGATFIIILPNSSVKVANEQTSEHFLALH